MKDSILINSKAQNWNDLRQAIDKGLHVSELEDLKATYQFSDKTLANLLGISSRTIARRKKERLTQDESTRIVLLVDVLEKVKELYIDTEDIVEWMETPNPHIDDYKPIDICTNIIGYKQVMNLLTKMEWGIPA